MNIKLALIGTDVLLYIGLVKQDIFMLV